MRSLALHRFLLRFALAGANVFAWIFIFQFFYLIEPDIGHALARVALLYALSQVITCLLTPYAVQTLRDGARPLLLIAVLFASSALVLLGGTFAAYWNASYASVGIAAYAIALGAYRAFYFVPYEIEVRGNAKRPRSRSAASELLIALAPFIAGIFIVSTTHGPVWVLYIAAGLIALSAIPLLYLRDIHEGFTWGYRETFERLFLPSHRPLLREAIMEGISGAALLLFWPIAVFLIAGWSYGMVGIILSLTFLIAILGRKLVRRGIRRAGLHRSQILNATFAATPWLFRIVVGNPLGVIFADSYFYTTTPRRIGVDALVFEQAADAGSYVDEYTALKEMGLALGRIAACILVAVVSLYVSLPIALVAVFLLAALASVVVALRPRS
ncbi:hypothetical protein A2763_02545 [Candidatus Kaiserbacteria bacterium RIFCSPHIGHO2_01_FULL_54_36]|uniref:Major facilitator superfamily (MFS) profile domain-containing protein n=1 Tax=Candidatus Kaiserbacteria bacterium RIFCSPHIGHO2_01_FULL_54_36 TaxID=1798482 RepID=A0A1F6CNY7_9BACT|nr:MAG: hypothetical protein A2763_02545 [Candidatus Kaiserbacteria bacterium RIFCSPHIGHO2_01_FULL_54_36]OGG75510.1 MAG: hypothetical protein A3A41_00395 [Candidatus Kaiserbacteria bacterium RIFCSPLOWO2_01_FULL_54_22]